MQHFQPAARASASGYDDIEVALIAVVERRILEEDERSCRKASCYPDAVLGGCEDVSVKCDG